MTKRSYVRVPKTIVTYNMDVLEAKMDKELKELTYKEVLDLSIDTKAWYKHERIKDRAIVYTPCRIYQPQGDGSQNNEIVGKLRSMETMLDSDDRQIYNLYHNVWDNGDNTDIFIEA